MGIDFLARSYQEPNTGCWLWAGSTCEKGYGRVAVNGVNKRAHRVCWEQYNGKIPDGLFVCHSCDTPGCVNIDHLWLGTPSDNMVDMVAKGRRHPNHGELNNTTKLTEAQVIEIRASGKRAAELAPIYGVAEATIKSILNGRNWKYLL